MHALINFFIELLAGWRVKDQANDWYEARQKAKSSRAEADEIIRRYNEQNK